MLGDFRVIIFQSPEPQLQNCHSPPTYRMWVQLQETLQGQLGACNIAELAEICLQSRVGKPV
jgi:hypothetical protein